VLSILYTVKQASLELSVSMQSIYVKIKLPEFADKIIKKQGRAFIDDTTLMLIKDSLKSSCDINNDEYDNTSNDEVASDSSELNINKDFIETLKLQLKVMSNQLNEKDNQLKQKDIQIGELHNLIENSQVLLKEKPHQDVLQLEEHFQDLDNKLIEIKEKMQNKDQDHKGIFKKIFSK